MATLELITEEVVIAWILFKEYFKNGKMHEFFADQAPYFGVTVVLAVMCFWGCEGLSSWLNDVTAFMTMPASTVDAVVANPWHTKFALDIDTNTYLLEVDGHLLLIDPADYAAVLEKCRNAASVTVLLTHEHFDHISGLNRIRDLCASSCRVISDKTCSERIQDEKGNLSAYADVLAELGGKQIPEHWSPFACKAADITFENRYAFHWMEHAMEMFSTPGHSAGSCCIVVDDLLFVGDTVLENNLMVKFPGSSKKLYRSVTAPLLEKWLLGNRVSCVYPGHGDVMSPEMTLGLIRDI